MPSNTIYYIFSHTRSGRLRAGLFPIGGEDVEFVAFLRVAIGAEHQPLAVGGEFRKRGEAAEVRDLLQAAAVEVHLVELKLTAVALLFVRREHDLASVRCERGGEAGAA